MVVGVNGVNGHYVRRHVVGESDQDIETVPVQRLYMVDSRAMGLMLKHFLVTARDVQVR